MRLILGSCLTLITILTINSCQVKVENSTPSPSLSGNSVRIGISSENLILEPSIKSLAQKATKKPIEIVAKGSVSLTELACKGELDAIAIADEMWPNIKCPDAPWTDTSDSLYQTRIQFALPTKMARELGWNNRTVTRQEILTALNSGRLNLATTIPTYSNSGYNTLLWLTRETINSNLAPEQITPQALEPLQPIYKNLAQKSESTSYLAEKLAQDWQPNTLAALYRFLYAPDGTAIYHKGEKLPLAEPVTLIEVTPAIPVTPTWFVATQDENLKQQLVEQVFEQLETKSAAAFERLRQLNPPLDSTIARENTPIVPVHQKLLDSFHPSVRQKRWIVGIIDASGSMKGDGYNQLLAAFEQLLIPENARTHFLYSPEDRFDLVVYQGKTAYSVTHDREMDKEAIRSNLWQSLRTKVRPKGGTPVDQGLLTGFQTALNIPPDYKTEIFLFTDGQFSDPITPELLSLYQKLQDQDAELTIVGAGGVDSNQLRALAGKLDARAIISADASKTLDELFKAFREAQI
ncbi:MAG: VWA domain-containing protein [Cyanobacteria bacterium P01_G01_bin.19]